MRIDFNAFTCSISLVNISDSGHSTWMFSIEEITPGSYCRLQTEAYLMCLIFM